VQSERSGASVRIAEFHETDATEPSARPEHAERNTKVAMAALVTAVLSFVIPPLNLIVLFFGWVARRETQSPAGRRRSEALTLTALVLAGTSLIASLLAAGIVTVRTLTAEPQKNTSLTTSAPIVVSTPVEPKPPTPSIASDKESRASTRQPAEVQHLGEVVIATIDPEVESLFDALDQQRALARAERRDLLVWLVASECSSCASIESAFADTKLQRVLQNTRVVRLDVRQFEAELRQLRIPTRQFPAFVRLSLDNNPLDYIDGKVWGDDTAPRIAPVLEDFLKGRLVKRRHTWRSDEQDEETAI
jgi:hypothetical protein